MKEHFFNFRCFYCAHRLHTPSNGLCTRCIKSFDTPAYCLRCGMVLTGFERGCGGCLKVKPRWDRICVLARYNGIVKELIHRLKFNRHHYLDDLFARRMLMALYDIKAFADIPPPQIILPVPLHPLRLFVRGFNQAEIVAKKISAYAKIPCDTTALQRVKNTPSQRLYSASERIKNVNNAFVYRPHKQYESVALFDDVLTTGATVNALCTALRKHKVSVIHLWILGRV